MAQGATQRGAALMEDALEAVGVGRYHYALLRAAGAAWFADGVEDSLLGFLSPAAGCEWGVGPFARSGLIASVFLGMAVSGPLWGLCSDRCGRKFTCIVIASVGVGANVASVVAPAFEALVALRFVVGLMLGGSSPVTLALLLESVRTKSRGQFGVAVDLFWSLGALYISGKSERMLSPADVSGNFVLH